ncbi:hypothetical protein FK531_03885 [Rhodococcus spelaei]|uniref:STAS domain-containing protein n=1 Tax=Rhodococcus spelaei TaxID=2546320 RepID=A0A541BNB0_9NOCA|nr:hypothetical protein [Rhodococcus spelaei]TQF73833.1 hypothetical protein FK531_03885 [Rhodococcus spelaei]
MSAVILDLEAVRGIDSRVGATVSEIGMRLRSMVVECVVVDGRSTLQRMRDDQRVRSGLDTVETLGDALALLG